MSSSTTTRATGDAGVPATEGNAEHAHGSAGQARGNAELGREIATEQTHVDRVYAELAKASRRATLVEAEGLARGRTDRTGDVRDEELTGLFERDALVYHAARRRHAIETQHEGLVFGRLDLDSPDPEVRYVGRLGVRDDDYEPLVIDWRAPAASPFYRATPVDRHGVLRRRVLRCRGDVVTGVEDDLMVPDAPEGMVVVGDGALMAALTRSRGARMRDIVATIQRHQDEAIRAPARGVTEITGGPGTGKTVVALHRAAYLLYSDRRRYESGGILVIGPSAAYTSYIERVLPSLGEDTVTLRSVGDVVDAVTTARLDPPRVAAIKGSLRIREVLARVARDAVPESPDTLRVMVLGDPVRLERRDLDRVRSGVLRGHLRNLGATSAARDLAEAALRQTANPERARFLDTFSDHRDVRAFLADWWPQLDAREVLLWLAEPDTLARHSRGILSAEEADLLVTSWRESLECGIWSVADVALIDDLAARLGPVQDEVPEERGFYEIEELEDLREAGMAWGPVRIDTLGPSNGSGSNGSGSNGSGSNGSGSNASGSNGSAAIGSGGDGRAYLVTPHAPRERLLTGRLGRPEEYAHVLVDESQDLSPMQWRMLGRRGGHASWTVVGDAAQSSWPDPAESARARAEAFGAQPRRLFHMDTNYRNAREIFDYAAEAIRAHVPDADIPDAVRETGVLPSETTFATSPAGAVSAAIDALADEVDGLVAVITPARHRAVLDRYDGSAQGRVTVVDPMSAKGLEYDATVIVDPDAITAESPGGVRVLYVALTRAAHRMTVVRPA